MRCPSARSSMTSAKAPSGEDAHRPTTTRVPLALPRPAIWPWNLRRCRPLRMPPRLWRVARDRPRQADHGSNPGGRVLQPHRAAAAADQLPGDGQTQPAAAGVAVTRLVEPGEAVEDALALPLRYAVPVVGHGQLDERALGTGRQAHAGGGVADGVVHEVAHGPQHLAP